MRQLDLFGILIAQIVMLLSISNIPNETATHTFFGTAPAGNINRLRLLRSVSDIQFPDCEASVNFTSQNQTVSYVRNIDRSEFEASIDFRHPRHDNYNFSQHRSFRTWGFCPFRSPSCDSYTFSQHRSLRTINFLQFRHPRRDAYRLFRMIRLRGATGLLRST